MDAAACPFIRRISPYSRLEPNYDSEVVIMKTSSDDVPRNKLISRELRSATARDLGRTSANATAVLANHHIGPQIVNVQVVIVHVRGTFLGE